MIVNFYFGKDYWGFTHSITKSFHAFTWKPIINENNIKFDHGFFFEIRWLFFGIIFSWWSNK